MVWGYSPRSGLIGVVGAALVEFACARSRGLLGGLLLDDGVAALKRNTDKALTSRKRWTQN